MLFEKDFTAQRADDSVVVGNEEYFFSFRLEPVRADEIANLVRRGGEREKILLTADVTPENSNIWGGVHGGFLYAMADTAAGAFARINYGQHNVTLNGSINYLRSTVQSKALTAVGRPVRVGGHIGFFEVNITDDTGALIARAEINMYFLKK